MPLNWMDVTDLPFTAVALFERVQLGWMMRATPLDSAVARALAVAFPANPQIEWVMRHKAPEIGPWLDAVLALPEAQIPHAPEEIRAAEVRVLANFEDWLIYALDPQIYDDLPFLNWDSRELLDMADGLITDLPFPDGFADIVMSGHVYGDDPEEELAECLRVTRPGGDVLFCPGNNDVDNEAHAYLVSQGFQWAAFEEPTDGVKRKYWRQR